MSASSKKKLRHEQDAAKLTERQLNEQKEAKQLKLYTAIFTGVLGLILVIALVAGVTQFITNSGIREKNTQALTLGDTTLSNAELNYYFIDAVNEFYSSCGSYAALFGLDVTKPLDQQVIDEETGSTWADDFTQSAISNAKATTALAAEAKANGYELSEDEMASIETNITNMKAYATIYGYANEGEYLKAAYGKGATIDSYREYCVTVTLANSYYNYYTENLTYGDEALREAEKENYDLYSSYSYNYYYLPVGSFLEGGTEDEDGKITYSDADRAAAAKKAEEAAKALSGEEIASVEDFDKAIAALSINAEKEASSTASEDVRFDSVLSTAKDWITDSARKAGDMTYVVSESTATKEDGTESTTINGYYVVRFLEKNDNTFALANVRHILISFEGGDYNEETGETTYSDAVKMLAQTEATGLLNDFTSGKGTEEVFATMATEHSTDTGSAASGGLIEDIYPGQMVESFNDWCFDESRKPGDTGVVESEYGYHVMYYVSDSETSYRDMLIESELRTADSTEWYTAVIEALEATEGDTKYLSRDLVLSNG